MINNDNTISISDSYGESYENNNHNIEYIADDDIIKEIQNSMSDIDDNDDISLILYDDEFNKDPDIVRENSNINNNDIENEENRFTKPTSLSSYKEKFNSWIDPTKAMFLLFIFNVILNMNKGSIGAISIFIEDDFNMQSWETGILWGAFIVPYMILSPVFARIAKYKKKTVIISIGYSLMVLSSIIGFTSFNVYTILFSRFLVGCGESAISPIVGPYIKTIAPLKKYTTWMGIYYAALPIGVAFGYIIGGIISYFSHWKYIFVIDCTLYSICLVVMILFPKAEKLQEYIGDDDLKLTKKKEMQINTSSMFEECDIDNLLGSEEDSNIDNNNNNNIGLSKTLKTSINHLIQNKTYIYVVFGCCALNFVAGTLGFWCPIYIKEVIDVSIVSATLALGIFTVIFGIIGSITGGKIVDYISNKLLIYNSNGLGVVIGKYDKLLWNLIFLFDKKTVVPKYDECEEKKQLLWIKVVVSCRIVVLLSLIQFILLFTIPAVEDFVLFLILFAISEFILFCIMAPVNTLVMDVVPKEDRELAVGLQIGIGHLIGDFPSPIILGIIRQLYGIKTGMILMSVWFLWVLLWFTSSDIYFRKEITSNDRRYLMKLAMFIFCIAPMLLLLYLVWILFFPDISLF